MRWLNAFLRWIGNIAGRVLPPQRAQRTSSAVDIPPEPAPPSRVLAEATPTPRGLGKIHREYGQRIWETTPPAATIGAEKARYADIENGFRRELKERWAEVDIKDEKSLRAFEKWFRRRLQERQAEVYLLAKRVRGDIAPLTEEELRFLHGRYSEQMRYFRRFLSDIRTGRGRMAPAQRLDLYAKDLWGIYQAAFWKGQVYTVGRRYLWVLGQAEHCEDCLHRAAESRAKGGYTWEELEKLGLPGEGKTRCLNNCQCTIEEIAERHYRPKSVRWLPNRRLTKYADLREVTAIHEVHLAHVTGHHWVSR